MRYPGRLPIIRGRDLPLLGWWGGSRQLSKAGFEPVVRIDRRMATLYTKPATGGLWTAPLRYSYDGRLLGCHWNMASDTFYRVHPRPNAKIVVVDDFTQLRATTERWPDTRDPYEGWNPKLAARWREADSDVQPARIDWVAMARDVDAFYLTRHALDQVNNPSDAQENGGLHLWGWDVPSVLFLNPAFYAGRLVRVMAEKEKDEILRDDVEGFIRRLEACDGDESRMQAEVDDFRARTTIGG